MITQTRTLALALTLILTLAVTLTLTRLQDGMTPLMWAAMKGHENLARMLIEHNAKVDAINDVRISQCATPTLTLTMPNAEC